LMVCRDYAFSGLHGDTNPLNCFHPLVLLLSFVFLKT
jgi:hypothetical protein